MRHEDMVKGAYGEPTRGVSMLTMLLTLPLWLLRCMLYVLSTPILVISLTHTYTLNFGFTTFYCTIAG